MNKSDVCRLFAGNILLVWNLSKFGDVVVISSPFSSKSIKVSPVKSIALSILTFEPSVKADISSSTYKIKPMSFQNKSNV
jgi:hypothetical protein